MTAGAARAAGSPEGTAEGAQTLIHTSNCSNPAPARVCGQFVYVERELLERALSHHFAAFDGLVWALREADARAT